MSALRPHSVYPDEDTSFDYVPLEGDEKDLRNSLSDKGYTHLSCGVTLKRGYTLRNFLAIPLATTTTAYMGTFSNVAIIFLLKSPEYFNVP